MNNKTNDLIGKLFYDKFGQMYIVTELINSKYKGIESLNVLYYPCSDSGGLIYKTKQYKKKLSEILSSGKNTFINN